MIRNLSKLDDRTLGPIAFAFLLLPIAKQIRNFYSPSGVNSWQITEWLISYEGGFVRRGLSGEIILSLSNLFEVPPSVIAVYLSAAAWIALTFTLIIITKEIVARYVLFSPLLIGMPIYSNFFIRKAVFQLLILTLILLALRRNFSWLTVLFVNAAAITAILNHEAFVFIGIPITIMTTVLIYGNGKRYFSVLAKFAPTLLTALLVIVSKGNEDIAINIRDSWNNIFLSKFPGYCCLNENPAAIDAIGWSTRSGISLSLSVLNDFVAGIVYVPLIWVVTWLGSIYAIGQWAIPTHLKRSFFFIGFIQSIAIAPLFLLGWDFGRWLFFIFVSSIVWVSIFKNDLDRVWATTFMPMPSEDRRPRDIVFFALILFLAIPGCCWGIKSYLVSTPAGANALVLLRMLRSTIGIF